MIRAAIDIGTNSVKLLIADIIRNESGERQLSVIYEKSVQTRLGRGLYQSKVINEQAKSDTLEVLKNFSDIISSFNCRSKRIIATSAMRDARNGESFANEISKALKSPVEIISGNEEANISYKGVTLKEYGSDAVSLLMDVGGGSTELVFGRGDKVISFTSLILGSVRCYESYPISDPPKKSDLTASKHKILETLDSDKECIRAKEKLAFDKVISTGGTAAAMACISRQTQDLDRDDIDSMEIPFKNIIDIRRQLWSMPLSSRCEIPGIPRKKSDILLMGVLIHEVVFEYFGAKVLCPSTKGLRYGALL